MAVTTAPAPPLGAEYTFAALLIVVLLVLSVAAEKRHIPSSAVLIVLGAAVGAILWPTGLDAHLGLRSVTFFDESLFVYILLPPIIFEAGFSLIKRPFFRNLGTILLFAVPGTVLTMLVIGGSLYAAGAYGAFRIDGADALDFRTPLDSFVFGALISATDPVATLSIMGALGVEPQLYAAQFCAQLDAIF